MNIRPGTRSALLGGTARSVLACLLLGLCGCAGSSPHETAGGTSSSRSHVWRPAKPDTLGPVVAIVAGRRFTRHDVDSILAPAPQSVRSQYQNPDMYKQLLERVVQQEALFAEAQKAGTESDSAYRVEIATQQRQLLIKHYYLNAIKALPQVPDSAVRRYYDEHADEFKVQGRARVRHIQVATQARARQVLRRLRGGMSWERACAQYSTDKLTAKSGGVVGFVTTDNNMVPGIGLSPAIVAAAFHLKEGETSEPLKSEKGWHLIRVDQAAATSRQPFEQAEKMIRSNLEEDRNERFQATLVDSLKKVHGATVFEDSIGAALDPAASPADLFQKAQAASSPEERIRLFRGIVARFPSDKSAIQAAFMIGFTYAEELSDRAAARQAFESFLKQYPQSDLAASAKWMLENMNNPNPPLGVGPPTDTLKVIPVPPGQAKGTNTRQ